MENENLNIELQKELQLELEKEKLKETIDRINKEILEFIAKRKSVVSDIEEYRKKILEEYKKDEDQVAEYFDHERYIKEESFKAIDRKLREMTLLVNAPYFGRIDFTDKELKDFESIYIGRFGITQEGELEPLVVDWRAPVASLFYNGGVGEASYNAPLGKVNVDINLRRQYIVKKQELKGMFDSEVDIKDEILQMVLSGNSSSKLKDIIMTIQKEQDELIRQPKLKTIVVDGVAGSGKTTIALHRVAYLLYNYRDTLQDKVLILGPNNIFIEYISSVLPSLGEIGVNQTTFINFAMDILQLDDIIDFKDYMEKIVNKDEAFISEVVHKNSYKYVQELEEFIDKLNNDYFEFKDVKLRDRLVISESDLRDMFCNYYKSMPLFRRVNKLKRIIFSKIRNVRDEIVRYINKYYKDTLASMTKEELELNENKLKLERSIKIRELIGEIIALKDSLTWLQYEDVLDLYKEINGDKELIFDDLAPLLYLKIKLEGYKIQREIKHIVIDEAQDYSFLQFLVLKEITDCSAMTIVGDSNQRLMPIEGGIPMLSLSKEAIGLDVGHFQLSTSYRSTKEIMEYANKYLPDKKVVPMVRSGSKVVEKSINSLEELKLELLSLIGEFTDKGHENIGIICKNEEQALKVSSLIYEKEHIKVLDKENKAFSNGVSVIPAYFAKGLEFDAVAAICSDDDLKESKLMYVMSTRALHELAFLKFNM